MKGVSLITWEEILHREYEGVPFLIDPYIPRESIVLLFADTSQGKSPLTWEMASAISRDTSFFGLPTQRGTSLYIEADTPEVVLAPRLKQVSKAPKDVWFLIIPSGLSVPTVGGEMFDYLVKVGLDIRPDVVFLNTLRKLHDLDDKDSRAPKLVYSFFQQVFPKTALVFVHHNRKVSLNPAMVENNKESFSGSKHWLDDAQVGLSLSPWRGKGPANIMLHHVKSQVSELMRPLPLRLHSNGTTITSPLFDRLSGAYDFLNGGGGEMGKGEIDMALSNRFGIGASTAKRDRLMVEHKLFPGSRAFLTPSLDDEEE